MITIETRTPRGTYEPATHAVQMRGTYFEVENAMEWHGKRWRTLRYCANLADAEAEIAEWTKDTSHTYRIVPVVDGAVNCSDVNSLEC